MQNQPLLYGVIGFLAGVVLMLVTASYAVNNQQQGMMRMMGMGRGMEMMMDEDRGMMCDDNFGMEQMMHGMTQGLEGKTGDAFDKAFLSEMIVHHQGAIDMAERAIVNAKHDEIKKLAEDIIVAQTSEIDKMKQWQKEWGY